LIEFKQRLLTANFLKYEVLCQPGDDKKRQEEITSSGEENVLRKCGEEFIATMPMTNYHVDSACEAFDNLAAFLSDSSAHKREENIALLVSQITPRIFAYPSFNHILFFNITERACEPFVHYDF